MSLLIRNIQTLVHVEDKPKLRYRGTEMSSLKTMHAAYLYIQDGIIQSYGLEKKEDIQKITEQHEDLTIIDASGRHVFPSWCDSHTHLVYAGSREQEFSDRIRGLSYEEVAARGGGILNSAGKLRKCSEDDLYEIAVKRMNEILHHGTGAVEIKSGYGLTLESELKMLRVIDRIRKNSQLMVRATFLGAHAIPSEFKENKNGYLELIINEMMPAVAAEGLADFCDVFCEQNYFDKSDSIRLFEAAAKYGMRAKVHAEQLSHSGGIEAGVSSKAISVDHLEFADENDIALLKNSDTMPVLLPGAQLFLGLKHPPARTMISSGLPVAISSDFNPGSCPSGNMNQMVSLACILYKMTPEESILAATTNSAYAMGISEKTGSIAVGKKGNVFITNEIPSYTFLPYYFGTNLVEKVILNGKIMDKTSF